MCSSPAGGGEKPVLTGTVTIENTSPEVGDMLIAVYSSGNGTGEATWQWLANGSVIAGANSNTYEVADSNLDKTLVVKVSFADQTGSVSSEPTEAVAKTTKPELTGTVAIDKTSPKIGDTLMALYSGEASGSPTWRWLANSIAIPGANSNTYTVTASELGKPLIAQVSYSNRSGSISSEPTSAVVAAPFTVTFDSKGGSAVPPQEVSPGGTAVEPAKPTKAPFYFDSWYTDNESRWNFADPVNSNMTLYAQWSEIFVGTSIDDISEFLHGQNGVAGNPVSMKVRIDLGQPSDPASGWRSLLTVLAAAKDYVILDLSACTMTGNIFDHSNDPLMPIPGTDQIVEIILPDVVISIGENAFHGCRYLTKVSGPKVKSISDYAFANCRSLTEVSFPEVTSISDFAFDYCLSLTKVSFPEVISIGEFVFLTCISLTEVNFPKAKSIGIGAFQNCIALTEVSFPKATSISTYAFYVCELLTEVSFPETTSFGERVFWRCESLRTITLGVSAPTVGYGLFYEVSGNPTITVKIPAEAKNYGAVPGTYSQTSDHDPNWANGFRGLGWNGSSFVDAPDWGNSDGTPVTLRIEYQ